MWSRLWQPIAGAPATAAFWLFTTPGLLGLSVPDWLGSSVRWGLYSVELVFVLALLSGLQPLTDDRGYDSSV